MQGAVAAGGAIYGLTTGAGAASAYVGLGIAFGLSGGIAIFVIGVSFVATSDSTDEEVHKKDVEKANIVKNLATSPLGLGMGYSWRYRERSERA